MSTSGTSARIGAATGDRLDIVVFFGSFFGGLVLYFTFRTLNVRQLFVTMSLVSVMFVYSIIVSQIPRLRVRLDQAGDNAYYLGLLFTLSSMAFALYDFSVAQHLPSAATTAGAGQIIGNFGIALATTITGIFLRVVLHEMRMDPAEVESTSRIELAEAAKDVKASLGTVSLEMSQLLNEMRQRTSDHLAHLVEGASETLGDYAALVTAATKRLTDATSEAHLDAIAKTAKVTEKMVDLAAQAEAAAIRLRNVDPPPLKYAKRLEQISEGLDKVVVETDRLGGAMSRTGEVSVKVNSSLQEVAFALDAVGTGAARQHEENFKRIEEASLGVQGALERIGKILDANSQRFAALEEQTQQTTQAANESQAAAGQVLDSLVAMTKRLTELIRAKP